MCSFTVEPQCGFVLSPLISDRNQVKAEYLMSLETSDSLLEEVGAQLLASGAYSKPEAVLQAIDAVSSSEVANVSVLTMDTFIIDRIFMHVHSLYFVLLQYSI